MAYKTSCQHKCPFKLNNCCWKCAAASECKKICKFNPENCEKEDNK